MQYKIRNLTLFESEGRELQIGPSKIGREEPILDVAGGPLTFSVNPTASV